MTTTEPEVKWSQAQMVEVTLNEPDDFLKVRETLTRIGVASRKEKVTDLEIIKQYYGYSNEKASQALKILTPEQIKFIKQRLEIGGSK